MFYNGTLFPPAPREEVDLRIAIRLVDFEKVIELLRKNTFDIEAQAYIPPELGGDPYPINSILAVAEAQVDYARVCCKSRAEDAKKIVDAIKLYGSDLERFRKEYSPTNAVSLPSP